VHTSIVILSGQLLFAEGVAKRLRQHLQHVDLKIINPRQPDTMSKIIADQPAIIILDVADSEAQHLCRLSKLLLLLPAAKIIRLDPHQNRFQVVTSEQHPAVEVRDLVEVIEQSI